MTLPTTASGTGLMAFWADIDSDFVLQYQQWHNCEHIPERVSIPGFLEGRRYRSISNEPHFLMMYETQATSTLASEAYMAALNSPTSWTREALTHFRNPVRGIYSIISTAGSSGKFTAPYITSLRFDLPEGGEDEFADRWLPTAIQAGGVERVRFYRLDTAVANIATSERRIYSGGPGKQTYLLLIEFSGSPQTEAVGDPIHRADTVIGTHVLRANEVYDKFWLEIALKPME